VQTTSQHQIFRFGAFELDIGARRLQRDGFKVRLEEKPFRLLALLVLRAGETLTRNELRKELWAGDIHVNFEHGLNNVINKIRGVLSDQAENSRFVATVPKVGYRFIAPVERVSWQEPADNLAARCEPPAQPAISKSSTRMGPPRIRIRMNSPLGIVALLSAAVAVMLVAYGSLKLSKVQSDPGPLLVRKAGEAYALGVYYQALPGEETLARSKEYLEQAVALDPAFPEAHAALALTEEFIGDEVSLTPGTEYQRAIVEAQRALDLDPSLAEAHVALGNAELLNEWDWRDAKLEYLRALHSDARSVSALEAYARLLGAIGEHEESLRVIRRAQELDPLSIRVQYDRAILSYLARDYEQAITQLNSLLEVHPGFADARKSLSDAYAREEQWDKASTALLKWLQQIQVDQGEIRTTKRVLREQGLPALWRQHSKGNACHRSPDGYGIPFNRAAYSALLGETDQAMQWLARAYAQHDNRLLTLKVDPQFDKVRSDPHFVSLLEKIGLTL
jgi:DNA-binding winged helix-turn-helix (wHTH) protein/tetratricopeptide (TPR) repeat protein